MSLDLFQYAEARQLRDVGMRQAAAHSPRYVDLAYAAIERLARRQLVIFTDDLADELKGVQPSHPNANGAPWMKAIRAGVIQRTNQVRPSRDPKKRAHLYPVYFSLLFDPRSS